jgi:hypothetical protein
MPAMTANSTMAVSVEAGFPKTVSAKAVFAAFVLSGNFSRHVCSIYTVKL